MSAFDFLDVSEDEAKEAFEQVERYGNRDGRICICGHSMKFHAFISHRGVHKCNAQKQSCPCRTPRAVLESSNTRVFIRKTHGAGGLHALTQGIIAAQKLGAEIEWLIEQKCDKCNAEVAVAPVPVTQDGRVANDATGWDKMLCRECRATS